MPLTDADRRLVEAVLGPEGSEQRRAIAKTITLLESTREDHRARADEVLSALLPSSGNAYRIGISGVPGAGKSTFIEALGLFLIERGERVAVLAVDPSSSVGGGSILGDKTRMERLSVNERAFIRPSPSSGTLGGVADKTREAIRVCEAAGYTIIIVETVGVGQSEAAVASMTDLFVLLQLPNAGDDLQAIKRGVTELADLIVVNKADLDEDAAALAKAHLAGALKLMGRSRGSNTADPPTWCPEVLQLSALKGTGLDEFWDAASRFREIQRANSAFQNRRQEQDLAWMGERIDAGLREQFRRNPAVRELMPSLVEQVRSGNLAASAAARRLLNVFSKPTN